MRRSSHSSQRAQAALIHARVVAESRREAAGCGREAANGAAEGRARAAPPSAADWSNARRCASAIDHLRALDGGEPDGLDAMHRGKSYDDRSGQLWAAVGLAEGPAVEGTELVAPTTLQREQPQRAPPPPPLKGQPAHRAPPSPPAPTLAPGGASAARRCDAPGGAAAADSAAARDGGLRRMSAGAADAPTGLNRACRVRLGLIGDEPPSSPARSSPDEPRSAAEETRPPLSRRRSRGRVTPLPACHADELAHDPALSPAALAWPPPVANGASP